MSTRTGKTNPDVALLIKRVEMDTRFKVEMKTGSNKVDIVGPDNQPLILSLNADTTAVRRAERALTRMGLGQEPAPRVREQVTVRKTSEVTDPYPDISIYEKAKKVWKGARDYAVAEGKSLLSINGADFYLVDDKPLAYFIGRHYRKIQHYAGPGGKQEIYDFLRSTGNYARERQEDESSVFVIRAEWSESGAEVVVRNPRKAVSDYERERLRKESKVTPKEAGEDREPAPFIVTHKEPEQVIDLDSRRTPADVPSIDPEAAAALAREQERKAALTCPECMTDGKEYVAKNPQGLSGHRRAAHGVQGTTYRPSVVGKIEPDSPLAEVGMAFDMLRDALAKVTGTVVHSICEDQISEAQREAEYQKADAQVQRERAERAEQTLACIRIAFDTLPVNKAVSEVLDLIPPVTE